MAAGLGHIHGEELRRETVGLRIVTGPGGDQEKPVDATFGATYLQMFGLAQAFNGFYHKYPVLNEEREDARLWRAAAVAYYRAQLTTALELMGCTVPMKM